MAPTYPSALTSSCPRWTNAASRYAVCGIRGYPDLRCRLGNRLAERRIHDDDVVTLAHRVDEANRVAGLGSKEALGGEEEAESAAR